MSNVVSDLYRSFRDSILTKLFVIFILILVLGIPIALIFGVISDRENSRDAAVRDISGKWGAEQVLTGPILTVPYLVHTKDEKGRVFTSTETAQFLPDRLEVRGSLWPEIRYRGIFEAVLYRADLQVEGNFLHPDFGALKIPSSDIRWVDAVLSLGVSDNRGLQENVALDFDGRKLAFGPGSGAVALFHTGIHVQVPLKANGSRIPFSLRLALNGSEGLKVIPCGRETTVHLSSSWPSPSFNGNYLPTQRSVGDKGFQADWRVMELARNFPQSWKKADVPPSDLESSAFGVGLPLTADAYQKTTRTAKYAVLFILLTFLSFFLFEVMSRLRVHPFQYLLVGAALLVFYLLTLALSERWGFGWSYLAASSATIGLITAYSAVILANLRRGLLIGLVLTVLYGYLYVLLQLEDYALLLGSVGLFVITGLVMYLTRKINWYDPTTGRPGVGQP